MSIHALWLQLVDSSIGDKLKEWFCCPAVLASNGICHTTLYQLSQNGLTLANDSISLTQPF